MHKMQSIKSLFFSLCTIAFLLLISSESWGQNAAAKRAYDILDYGAVPDGKTLNTKAIQTAIDAASKNNGGKVVFQKDVF